MSLQKPQSTETGLVGMIVRENVQTDSTTIYAEFTDKKTGVAREPQAGTLIFTLDKDDEKFEMILAESHTTTDGVTEITVATNGRSLLKYGNVLGSATGNRHVIGKEIGIADVHIPLEILNEILRGNEGTGGKDFRLGDETDSDITFYAQNADTNKPFIRYDKVNDKWVFSNDGISTTDVGGGTGSITAGDGIDITAGIVKAKGAVQVSSGDTNANYLEDKLTADDHFMVTKENTGADESFKVGFDSNAKTDFEALTDGSNADALHIHSGLGFVSATAGEPIDGSSTPKSIFVSGGGYYNVSTTNQTTYTENDSVLGYQTFTKTDIQRFGYFIFKFRNSNAPVKTLWIRGYEGVGTSGNMFYEKEFPGVQGFSVQHHVSTGLPSGTRFTFSFTNGAGTQSNYIQLAGSDVYPGGKWNDSENDIVFYMGLYDCKSIIQSQQSTLYNLDSSIKRVMQSFTPLKMKTLGMVEVAGSVVGNPSLPVMELFLADANENPTGSVLETKEVLYDDGVMYSVFSSELTVGEKYIIVLKAGGTVDSVNYYSVLYKDSDVYAGGSAKTSADSGATWSGSIGDLTIKIYGTGYLNAGFVYKSDNTNAITNFFDGFSVSDVITWDEISFKTVGQQDSFAGLSVGQKYYVGADGAIAGSGDVEVGRAVSSSSIYIG